MHTKIAARQSETKGNWRQKYYWNMYRKALFFSFYYQLINYSVINFYTTKKSCKQRNKKDVAALLTPLFTKTFVIILFFDIKFWNLVNF